MVALLCLVLVEPVEGTDGRRGEPLGLSRGEPSELDEGDFGALPLPLYDDVLWALNPGMRSFPEWDGEDEPDPGTKTAHSSPELVECRPEEWPAEACRDDEEGEDGEDGEDGNDFLPPRPKQSRTHFVKNAPRLSREPCFGPARWKWSDTRGH